MDELLIEEKKYVSSKRAAKMTGYAKDYIGQLCREGRVPARLVGRSWYVLETAIQDHRFGTADIEADNGAQAVTEEVPAVFTLPSRWGSSRYEASKDEILPSINRLEGVEEAPAEEVEEIPASEHIQDSWRDWFEHIGDTKTAPPAPEEEEKPVEETVVEESKEEEHTKIPIHTIYRQPPEELLPRNIYAEMSRQEEPQEESEEQPVRIGKNKPNRTAIRAIQVGGVLFAGVMAVLAFIGTGYLDEYIISNNQVRIISGVGLYNK